jgi:hypothetical protein
MSKPEDKDKPWFLQDDFNALVPPTLSLTQTPIDELLRIYREEMTARGVKRDVMIWHLIILDNFIGNFLAEHGKIIVSVS